MPKEVFITPPPPPVKTPHQSRLFKENAKIRTPFALPLVSDSPLSANTTLTLEDSFSRQTLDSSTLSPPDEVDESPCAGPPLEEPASYFDLAFENLGLLGAGSFGDVVKACNRQDGKLCAIKKSRRCWYGPIERSKVLEEVKMFTIIGNHPHCVQLLSAWEQRGHLYLQMELCTSSLSELISKRERIDEPQLWTWTGQIGSGLHHIHAHHVVHLDIKPSNIFVDFDGVLKIGDFGLMTRLSQADTFTEGDASYMAAELIANGITELEPTADIFSFGATLLELMTRMPLPTSGVEWHDVRHGPRGRFQLPDSFSPELIQLVTQMLSSAPAERPSAATILLHRKVKVHAPPSAGGKRQPSMSALQVTNLDSSTEEDETVLLGDSYSPKNLFQEFTSVRGAPVNSPLRSPVHRATRETADLQKILG